MSSVQDKDEIQDLRKKGYKAADVHVHTFHSPDVFAREDLSPQRIYETAIQKGMDFVIFTDHDSISAHQERRDRQVCGFELSVNDPDIGFEVHLNIYEVTQEDFSYLIEHNTNMSAVLTYCRNNHLPHTYNHPFWFDPADYFYVMHNPQDVYESIQWIASHVDVIEINHSRPRYQNDMARVLAQKHKKALIIGTDTHTGEVATAYTMAKGKTFREWYTNVKNHNGVLVEQTSSEWCFDREAYQYMNFSMTMRTDDVHIKTDNVVADALIRMTNSSKLPARILTLFLWPLVSIATRSGIARKWYFFMQRSYTRKLHKLLT